ncbi:hypothetical protein VSP9026_04311 [Vibrio spartinae]|uniref:Uncharacterized protein n=1 Tax=Vibrio spartinae TaxID=1918945 RepID=A0A1N6MAM6_9VIBR|nr:hypothetical protein VSP9026_04311 [Vibrio spartinae]
MTKEHTVHSRIVGKQNYCFELNRIFPSNMRKVRVDGVLCQPLLLC